MAAILLTGLLAAAASPAEEAGKAYVIGPRDILDVQVYEQADLNRTVRVSEDGKINLPLIGDVTAAGLTVETLVAALTAKFTDFIYNPQVSVYIKEYFPKEIYVLGEVGRPGIIRITGNPTLLEVLSQAGGVGSAGGDTLNIIRRSGKDQEAQTITLSLSRLLGEGSRDLNIEVKDGDTLYIPRADYFFIFGEVERPGSFKLEQGMKINVLKAISLAGGFTDKAAKGKMKITREEGGQKVTFKADLNTELRPNDIIIVPESFF